MGTTQPTAVQTVQVNARIEGSLYELLSERAQAADRSLAAEIRQAIRAWVEPDETEAVA